MTQPVVVGIREVPKRREYWYWTGDYQYVCGIRWRSGRGVGYHAQGCASEVVGRQFFTTEGSDKGKG